MRSRRKYSLSLLEWSRRATTEDDPTIFDNYAYEQWESSKRNLLLQRACVTSNERILINVSGEIFETRLETLERYPETLLGDRDKRILYYCRKSGGLFFQRSPLFFDAILFFYQSYGILRCPYKMPADLFQEECRFFELPEDAIMHLSRVPPPEKPTEEDEKDDGGDEERTISNERKSRMQLIYQFLQYPESSPSAQYFSLFSLIMVFISVLTGIIDTHPAVQFKSHTFVENPWAVTELVLNSWFFIELTACLITSPNKIEFLKQFMTLVDIIAVIPYFILLAFTSSKASSFRVLKIIRLVRITRLLHISKQSREVKQFGCLVKACITGFQTLFACLFVIVLFGGSLTYYAEMGHEESMLQTLPASCYWALQTITTVGYGDLVPMTSCGKLVGALFMTCGVMLLTMPLLSLAKQFEKYNELI